ncbi:MAG: hypothetical protein OHK0017_07000 [Patescibacteria group bacterium]
MDFSKHKIYQKALLGFEIEQFCTEFLNDKQLKGVVQVQENKLKMLIWFNMENSIACSVVMFESLLLSAKLKQVLLEKKLIDSETEIAIKARVR